MLTRRSEQEGCLVESSLRRFRLGQAESDVARGPIGKGGRWTWFRVPWAATEINSVVRKLFCALRARHSIYLDFVQYTICRAENEEAKYSVDVLALKGRNFDEAGWVEVKWTRRLLDQATESWGDGWRKIAKYMEVAQELDKWRLDENLRGEIKRPLWFGVLMVSPTCYCLRFDNGDELKGFLEEDDKADCDGGLGEGGTDAAGGGDGNVAVVSGGIDGDAGGDGQGRGRARRRRRHGQNKQAAWRETESGWENRVAENAKRIRRHSSIAERTRAKTFVTVLDVG